MKKLVSILRGINVSGQKKILMADLKQLYQQLEFENIITYIQSGNVIFETDIEDESQVKSMIESAIKSQYGFEVPVIIRQASKIQDIIDNDPYLKIDKAENSTKIHVAFLSQQPQEPELQALMNVVNEPEQLVIVKNHAYIWYANGCGRSKLTINVIERKLKLQATGRNWKTIVKLAELSS